MKYSIFLFVIIALASCGPQVNSEVSADEVSFQSSDQYPDHLDAVIAAPSSHEVLIDNERVRVLRVVIHPGEKEPLHHHKWESVMYVEQPSRIRYYNDSDEIAFESPNDQTFSGVPHPNWMEAEGVHAVENIDTIDFIALRVELKD